MQRTWLRWFALISCVSLLLGLGAPTLSARPGKPRFAVASEGAESSRAAIAVLRAGGNAVDAMIAAALVAGVTNPNSSGLGGGGFALYWDAKNAKAHCFDFRETAPRALDAAVFEQNPFPEQSRGQWIGVPGELRGLHELHTRFGSRAWGDLVAPAERAAQNGFSIGEHLASMLTTAQGSLSKDAGIAQIFYPGGRALAFGKRAKNPKLAATLARIRAEGPDALYRGAIASELADTARRLGGGLAPEDLAGYAVRELEPLHASFQGYEVFTMPPPSAGGMMLIQALRSLSAEELRALGYGTGAYTHLVAESLRGSIADRMRYVGDPAFESVNVEGLIAEKRMAERRSRLALDRTHWLPRFGLEEHGTHHLVTADRDGNVMALTTTVNRLFGVKSTGEGSGIVLNDELDDFTRQRDVAKFGMQQSPNRPRAGARPVSSMTPTLVVKDGQVVLALGGSGGTTIATNVTQMTLAALVFGLTPQKALASPRFYIPTEGGTLRLEEGAAPELAADLALRGEVLATAQKSTSAVQMIAIRNGVLLPAADPRKHGSALSE